MNFPIEHNGCQAVLLAGSSTVFELTGNIAWPLTTGPNYSLMICSWCVDVNFQTKLRAGGYTLSHGICKECSKKALTEHESSVKCNQVAIATEQTKPN